MNRNELLQHVFNLVESLNDEVAERNGLEYYVPFEISSIGWQGTVIKFMGIIVWTEQDDEREWIECDNDYEPLRNFVLREADKILKDLNLKMGAF